MEVDNVAEKCGYCASVDVVGDDDIPGVVLEREVADCEDEDTMEDKKESREVPEDVNANVDIGDNVNSSDKDEGHKVPVSSRHMSIESNEDNST